MDKAYRPVLDACCGSRMFWFDSKDPRALFVDCRKENHEVTDRSMKEGIQRFSIDPDIVADFTNLPFEDGSFAHVVFDPPHLVRAGASGFLAKKYGVLLPGWEEMIRGGFEECFRVLKSEGTLIFKWSEAQIPLKRVLELVSEKPLYGHRSGPKMKTHWVAFLKSKPAASISITPSR